MRPEKGGRRQLEFYFICTKQVTKDGLPAIFLKFLTAMGGEANFTRFSKIFVVAEDKGLLKRNEKYTTLPCSIETEVRWVPTRTIEDILREKKAHKAAHLRQPGHVSTHAPEFLKRDSCVVVIGSRGHLADHIILYLEDYGVLKRATIDALRHTCELRDIDAASEETTTSYFELQLDKEQRHKLYRGNFNRLWLEVTTALLTVPESELLERLGEDPS